MIAKTTAIATPHPDATAAARSVIAKGGNAVDASVAAMLTLCVVMPQQVGLGGYGGSFVAYLGKQKRVAAIDFDSIAPRAFRPELYNDYKMANHGYLALTVPAIIAGLGKVARQFGRLPFGALCEYAAEIAEKGFPVSEIYRKQLDLWATRTDPVSFKALFPNGKLPGAGELWIQRDKAILLRKLGVEGPESFYRGEIARKIVGQVRSHGGILTEEDFADCRARDEEALKINYRGHEIITPGLPSGGITTLQILKTLENFDVNGMPPLGAEYFHLFAEATKLCWVDRMAAAGDPDFVTVATDKLLSDENAAEKAARIRNGGIAKAGGEKPSGPHTANVLVADAEENVVSMTATQGYLFGSQVVIDGLGIIMGHGMSRFDYEPGSANAPAVGKRMFHNMAPSIVLKDGKPRFAVGLPGGPKIVTVTAQLLVDLIDFKKSAAETVAAPRIHVETQEPVAISSAVPDAVAKELEKMGHTIRRGQDVGGPPTEIAGMANAVAIDEKTGEKQAASQGGAGAAVVF